MIKKCIGCGLTLQNVNKDDKGYTPNLDKDYCMRCFRLKNYGERKQEMVQEKEIFDKLKIFKDGLVIFLIDYLNLSQYTLNLFKKISKDKVLVVSKSDTLRRDFKYDKIKKWLNKVYQINEEVLFLSNKNNYQNINIFNIMDKYKTKKCFIMGITNAGKSTFVNSILKSNNIKREVLVSNKSSTTLDFMSFKINDYIIYDTPGFSDNSLNYKIIDNIIKPINFNLKKPTKIIINNLINLYFLEPNNITIYTTHKNVKRDYNLVLKDKFVKMKVLDNHDLVIPGLGFINIKKQAEVYYNGHYPLEIRPSISGD